MSIRALAEMNARMHYDPDKIHKGLDEKRPENIRYEPVVGATWTYFDAEAEGLVEWKIEAIEGTEARITKLTGRDIGYTTMYELSKMKAKRWKPLMTEGAVHDVLWACPDCGENNPIRLGDYMCIKCRELLDSGA